MAVLGTSVRGRWSARERAGTVSVPRAALLVAAKDLRVELTARVTTNQVLPFAGIVLLLFAFAADPDRTALRTVAPGMFWTAVLLAAVLAAGRSAALEVENGTGDALRLSLLDPCGVFLGKVTAVAVQLVVLECALLAGLVAVYDFRIAHPGLLAASAAAATVAIAALGVLYGTLATSLRTRETLLPLLTLPVLAPVALGAARAWAAAQQSLPADGTRWLQLLTLFACVLLSGGLAAYGSLLEEG